MLTVTRFVVPAHEVAEFHGQVQAAVAAYQTRPGHQATRLGQAIDDPTAWALVSEWDSVGAYRRALSSYAVRMAATALLARAEGGPAAFEVLLTADVAGTEQRASDRSADRGRPAAEEDPASDRSADRGRPAGE